MDNYAPQVDKSHYGAKYRSKDRWLSYFYQLKLVRELSPLSLLEIGPGEGVVTDVLRKDGVAVTTIDIAPDLNPDVVGSVIQLPFKDKEFDLALACEILEHIKFEDVPQALRELVRVSRAHVVISLPHPGQVLFSGVFKLPFMSWRGVRLQVPFFWKTHRFNGEHYWELGKKGFSESDFLLATQQAGLTLKCSIKYADDPVHRFFVFSV